MWAAAWVLAPAWLIVARQPPGAAGCADRGASCARTWSPVTTRHDLWPQQKP